MFPRFTGSFTNFRYYYYYQNSLLTRLSTHTKCLFGKLAFTSSLYDLRCHCLTANRLNRYIRALDLAFFIFILIFWKILRFLCFFQILLPLRFGGGAVLIAVNFGMLLAALLESIMIINQLIIVIVIVVGVGSLPCFKSGLLYRRNYQNPKSCFFFSSKLSYYNFIN